MVGAVAGLRLLDVARDLRQARKLLDDAGRRIEAGDLSVARRELGDATALLTRANSGLYGSLPLDVLGSLPIGRQNVGALRDTVGVALRLADGGRRILSITQPFENSHGNLEVPLNEGQVPLSAIVALRSETASLAAALPREVPRGSSLLYGAIGDAQHRVFSEGVRRARQLDSVARGLELLQDLGGASGPRRYLIAVANSAEMRGAGGMILSYGTLLSEAGKFTLGDFGSIDDLKMNGPVPVDAFRSAGITIPPDYLARWAPQQPTELWRNTTLSPDFSFDARVMSVMYQARTGLALDGVIQVDPAGLAAILRGTGPVEVPTLGTVTADNVVDLALNRAYIDFPDRDQRQELLGNIAKSTFEALVSGRYGTLRPLGQALQQAAASRHIILYSASPSTESLAATFDATGSLPRPDTQDYALLTVQNFSKNKLDYYLDSSLSLAGTRPVGQAGNITATISLTNSVPAGVGASYVTGPNAPGEVKGLYRGVVSLYVPEGTSLLASSGDATTLAPSVTTEAGRTVVSLGLDVPAGETRTVSLELRLAPRPATIPYSFRLVPSPRVRPTVVSVDIDADGRIARGRAPLETRQSLVPEPQISRK